MIRFEKKNLKDVLFSTGHQVTWRMVRDAFQRIHFYSAQDSELCAMLFQDLLKKLPQCNGHYNDCLDICRMIQDDHSPEIRRIYGGLKKELDRQYPRIRQLLVTEGFIEVDEDFDIALTDRGHSLRMQKLMKPITRAKAESLIEEISRRAQAINNDPDSTHGVQSVHVYGSYLTEKEQLGDLDIAVSTFQRRRKGETGSEWVYRDQDWSRQFRCKHGSYAIYKRLRINNSVSISPLDSLLELVEEGRASERVIFKKDSS